MVAVSASWAGSTAVASFASISRRQTLDAVVMGMGHKRCRQMRPVTAPPAAMAASPPVISSGTTSKRQPHGAKTQFQRKITANENAKIMQRPGSPRRDSGGNIEIKNIGKCVLATCFPCEARKEKYGLQGLKAAVFALNITRPPDEQDMGHDSSKYLFLQP